MKLNLKVFKSRPVLWIVGGIVLFVIFYLMFNKGGSGTSTESGGITTINTGPSDAAIAASTQLQLAQVQAGAAIQQSNAQSAAAIAIATLQAQSDIANTQASADVAKYTAGVDAATQGQYLNVQKEIAQTNAEYSYDTAKVASETALGIQESQQQMFEAQLGSNVQMLQIQSSNLITQSLIAQIPSLKSKDRDNALWHLSDTLANSGALH